MKHKVKVTVIDKKLYPELQKQYLVTPICQMLLLFASAFIIAIGCISCSAPETNSTKVVYFGKYPQGKTDATPSPIEWMVLDEKDGNTLLVTAKVIDSKPFHNQQIPVTWDNCDLRTWLNREFYNIAFSPEEQSAIASSEVTADKNPRFDTPVGKTTQDKVFLLSYQECLNYMPQDKDRKCFPTEYAISRGCYINTDGHAAWWLRSNGMSETEPEHLATWGNFSLRHHYVDDPILGDRPAIRVNSAYLEKHQD